jgi:formylglycine-generating enzyme required for sulfatase activity
MNTRWSATAGSIMTLPVLLGSAALAQDHGFDWVTIGDLSNPAYPGDQYGQNAGRGSIAYEYRIGRYEVTTAQWMEFVNTFSTQSDELEDFAVPLFWGAVPDPTYDGPGQRYTLYDAIPDADMLPVLGMDWREAAMYCNWLHNGGISDLSSIEDGAYDTSTFHTNPDGTFTDQATHHPDARFWIPTLDEWLKAAHYDPNKGNGGGWWLYNHGSDQQPIPGFPGEGETSTGLEWGPEAFSIPLGAYPNTTSPWGLLDVTGGAEEWTEEIKGQAEFRTTKGAGVAEAPEFYYLDQAGFEYWQTPGFRGLLSGLRVASAIPSPGGVGLVPAVCLLAAWRRRR